MSISKSSPNTLAVIADIHGNRWALEAVLQDIDRRNIAQNHRRADWAEWLRTDRTR